ncbi:MAG: threonine aldolase family protein [Actinomycetota bacterium]
MDIRVNLYSDTQTRPTDGMRRAMAEAEVGDEQLGEDPTVNRLQERVAELLGKETAVFLPSGTMCNEISFGVHCRPGDEIVMDRSAHPLNYEAGGPAALTGALIYPIDGDRGIFTARQLEEAIRPASRYAPRTRAVSVENTTNRGGGACWPLETMRDVCSVAGGAGLAKHLDGARLMNAVVATGVSAHEYAAPFDSAWIDFSKGLGAPIGACLAGTKAFIDEAWRLKQRMGGAMRQAGIVAAGALYALDNHVDRLAEDHENAKRLAEGLAELPGIELDPKTVETNIVVFDVAADVGAGGFAARMLEEQGVRFSEISETRLRAVTHLDVDRKGIDVALSAAETILVGR